MKYKFVSAAYAPTGYWGAFPLALNDAGRFCGYAVPKGNPGPYIPVVSDAGTGQWIAPLANEGMAYDINEAGDVVGFTGWWQPDIVAFLHRGGTTRALSGLPGPRSMARGINNDATIVGMCSGPAPDAVRGFVYDGDRDAVTEIIDPLPGHQGCYAMAINDDGVVVGISYSDVYGTRRLFRRRNGTTEDLGPVEYVAAVNRGGTVVGQQTAGAFRYLPTASQPGFETIGPAGSVATDINDAGVVVGAFPLASYDLAPFVYYPAGSPDPGLHDLNDRVPVAYGGTLYDARAVSASGRIVGAGEYQGRRAAILLEPKSTRPDVMDRYVLRYLKLLGGVESGGGGWGVPHGGGRVPIPPRGLQDPLSAPHAPSGAWLMASLAAILGDERLSPEMRRLAAELSAAARRELDGP